MAKDPSATSDTRPFVLALGLLVGFVFGFVVLLSRLPPDTALADYEVAEAGAGGRSAADYEFYTLLEQERAAETVTGGPVLERPPQRVIPPATRVVPGNAQSIDDRNLAAESYAEIPASSLGQESWYLQAGNFGEPGEAERARAAVLLLGLEAFIVTRQDPSGATGHRVRIGPFFDRGRLTEAKKRLRAAQVPYDIIRVTG